MCLSIYHEILLSKRFDEAVAVALAERIAEMRCPES
jgi:hypothetical protein